MIIYLPYIVSVLCAVVAGFVSYAIARKQSKADIQKLERQHVLDIEKEREKFSMDKEKLKIEHRHQLELIQKETENTLGANLANSLFSEAIKLPVVRQNIQQGIVKKRKQ